MRTNDRLLCSVLLGLLFVPLGCAEDDGDIGSEEDARRAYLGLDESIEKALNLGMDGFNAASNANIPTQSGMGEVSGTITIDGQVDQGASDNKGLRLYVAMLDYTDGLIIVDVDEDGEEEDEDDIQLDITYDTDAEALPFLQLSLRNYPDGTLEGTLLGTYFTEGDIEGEVTLDLTMTGDIEEGEEPDSVSRVIGSTHITGTATNDDGGVYDVDLTI